jgi:hypothetical protein
MGCGFRTICDVVAGPLSDSNTQRTMQAEPRVLALAPYAHQRGVSLLLAKKLMRVGKLLCGCNSL